MQRTVLYIIHNFNRSNLPSLSLLTSFYVAINNIFILYTVASFTKRFLFLMDLSHLLTFLYQITYGQFLKYYQPSW